MNSLILHNGNQLVKPWFSSKLKNSKIMPCIADSWTVDGSALRDFDSRIQYSKSNTNVCTDLTCADNIPTLILAQLKETFTCVKIISDHNLDIANLDPAWELDQYNQMQWLRASLYRLSMSDELIFWHKPKLPSAQTTPPIIFTTGRSGTHVLKEVLDTKHFCHHDNNIIADHRFQRLITAEFIGAVARKSFLKYLLSVEIAKQRRLIITTVDSFKEIQQEVQMWQPIHIDKDACDQALDSFANYVDLLLALFYFYNKSINFSLLEDLSDHYDSIAVVKNPYHAPDLCSNYDWVAELCEKTYQPIYENILKKLQLLFGNNCYKHV
jgi:hypothetical protein